MFALIVSFAVLAQVGGEYHYQQPAPFQLPNQHNSQGGAANNQHYSGGIVHNQQPYSGVNYHNVNYNHYSNNPVQNLNLASSSNYFQGTSHSVVGANSQTLQQANVNSINLNSISAAPAQPIVKKHIYFHVPPPDVEASVAPASFKRKKTYNIVFIKLPSQEPKYLYYTNPQGVRVSPYAPAEQKTIIYVLVKKPESLEEVRARSPPNHEVYYVKYKGSANSAVTNINESLSGVSAGQILRPGLVNGQE